MSRVPSVARHERAGRVEPVRLGLRYAIEAEAQRSDDGAVTALHWIEAKLVPGVQQLGPFAVALALDSAGDAVSLDCVVTSRATARIHLDSVVLGLRWVGAGASLRFLRHGWQS